MALIPGTLPSDTCYGTPQDLLELFAQYLSIPAADFQSGVVFNTSSVGLATDIIWFDTTVAANPILHIYVSGSWVDYFKNYIDNRTAATTPLGASDYIPVLQGGVVKKIAATNLPYITYGRILQVVGTNSTSVVSANGLIPNDNTIPQNTEGQEVLTLAITPQSATSTLYISFYGAGEANFTNYAFCALFKDSDANALCAVTGFNYGTVKFVLAHSEVSGSTTARTYKIRAGRGAGSGTLYFNADYTGTAIFGGVSRGLVMTIMEVAP